MSVVEIGKIYKVRTRLFYQLLKHNNTKICSYQTFEYTIRQFSINLTNYLYDFEPIIKECGGKIIPKSWKEVERLHYFIKLDSSVALVYRLKKEELNIFFLILMRRQRIRL